MNCPRCGRELERMRMKGPGTAVDHCRECGGTWFDKGEVAEVLGARAVEPLMIPPDAPAVDSKQCPRCRRPLAVFAYPGTLTVIDACRSCHGVWIDAGEIEEIHAARERKSMSCPKCGTVQPKAETCMNCGVVVEKALSAPRRAETDGRVTPPPPPTPASEPASGGLKHSLLQFVDEMLSRLWAGIRG
ncbi:MAG: zf-TFIIB domain-containing protein [Acidobacteria bacterium]|nr:zf-TFIIB domain-containing protein [Acidobacteriota bacterium]